VDKGRLGETDRSEKIEEVGRQDRESLVVG
jgi:hypothetical protein